MVDGRAKAGPTPGDCGPVALARILHASPFGGGGSHASLGDRCNSLSLSILLGAVERTLAAQSPAPPGPWDIGLWSVSFDHLPNNNGLSAPFPVDPVSDSIVNPGRWITQNLPLAQQVTPGQGMNTVHVCLIPSGFHRGEVLVWDGNLTAYGTRTYQPWSIVNPYWPALNPNAWPGQSSTQHRFYNATIAMPAGQGELFCAGQDWLPDGRLLVAGGTKQYPLQTGVPNCWVGARYVWQWDPTPVVPGHPFGKWWQMADLEVDRWYPTVRYDGSGTNDSGAIVIGGTNWFGGSQMQAVNSYEVARTQFNSTTPLLKAPNDFDRKPTVTSPPWSTTLSSNRQYWGPYVGSPSNRPGFGDYPRLHVSGILDTVSTGTAPRLFVSGFPAWGMRWAHDMNSDPFFGTFTNGIGYELGQFPANNDIVVGYGTSILLPGPIGRISTQVARIGGYRQAAGLQYESSLVETASLDVLPSSWLSGAGTIPPMHYQRYFGNVVILPTGDLFAIGGQHADPSGGAAAFNLVPELLVGGTKWKPMAEHVGARDYHSAAILLPDARVFVCGGENRKNPGLLTGPGKDYAIWEPPYFHLQYGSVPPTGITVTTAAGVLVPQNAIGPLSMHYGQNYKAHWTNTLEAGIEVNSVVLVRPAALTHHDDGGQRLVRLLAWHDDDTIDTINFQSPGTSRHAPVGWWMLFLVNSAGRPSNAYWVHLQ